MAPRQEAGSAEATSIHDTFWRRPGGDSATATLQHGSGRAKPAHSAATRESDHEVLPFWSKMAPSPPRLRILSGWSHFRSPILQIKSLHISVVTSQKLQHSFHTSLSFFAFVRRCINCSLGMDLLNVCVVGGNAVSAFLSWRLQATNACDVTLVWKSGFDAVFQYGISFK